MTKKTLFTIPAIRARALEATDKHKISVLIRVRVIRVEFIFISSLSTREDDLIVLQNVQIRQVLRLYYLLWRENIYGHYRMYLKK